MSYIYIKRNLKGYKMIKMKNILAENLIRFGTKNLTEAQKRQLRKLLIEAVDPTTDTELQKYLLNWFKNASKTNDFSFTPYVSKNYVVGRLGLEEVAANSFRVKFNVVRVVPIQITTTTKALKVPGIDNFTLEMSTNNKDLQGYGTLSVQAGKPDFKSVVNFNDLKTTGEATVPDQISTWLSNDLEPAKSTNQVGAAAMKSYVELIKPNFADASAETKKSAEWPGIYNKIKYKGILDLLGYKP